MPMPATIVRTQARNRRIIHTIKAHSIYRAHIYACRRSNARTEEKKDNKADGEHEGRRQTRTNHQTAHHPPRIHHHQAQRLKPSHLNLMPMPAILVRAGSTRKIQNQTPTHNQTTHHQKCTKIRQHKTQHPVRVYARRHPSRRPTEHAQNKKDSKEK